MSRIITVANSKGGVGKTTLCLHLYHYLKEQGASCGVCDLDYQKSITRLGTVSDLVEFSSLPNSPYGFVLVDTPPYRTTDLPGLLNMTDFLLIPTKPSVLDLQAAAFVIEEAKTAGVKYGLCLNMVRPGTRFLDDIKNKIEQSGWPLMKTEVRERVSYARGLLFKDGLQTEANKKADDEISDLTNEILIQIANG